ncbi:hypothetical protein LOTGIDRAFT_232962 [Lottia gigantea]|uniref:Transmembrane protein 126A n=1 Tax=Lottia gigantea TaxID=225164 RepID=V3ZND8_LOTGI|nr:hypothetical protein LOTGIDRAFT_232962 [Lottia gigantea]ESO92888.1 hypothetical protein LOTGIDRAFT_232962 [Lottia gigantea]
MKEGNSSDVLGDEQFKKIFKEAGWPVRYGSAIVITSGVITGNIFNNHYRTICRMGKAFRMTTLIPVALFCPLFGGILHAAEVNKLILKKKLKLECPVCYELKSGFVQLIAGGIYPLLTAFVCCTGLTKKHKPSNLQKIGMFDTTSKLSQFNMVLPKRLALSLFLFNFVIGAIIAQLELRSLLDQMKEEGNQTD